MHNKLKISLLFIFLILKIEGAIGQKNEISIAQKQAYLSEFVDLLAIPNVVTDTLNISKTAQFIGKMMEKRGITPQYLDGYTKGMPPVVFGEINVGAKETIVFYAHYDGQPVNPNNWAEGLHPFKPKLYNGALDKGAIEIPFDFSSNNLSDDWRIYARSASDDKGGVFAILNAYDILVKSGQKPTVNLKFFFEGEEEAGSVHLGEILQKHKDKLNYTQWIICDGPVNQTGRKAVNFGVRGDVNMDIKVFGPKRPLHSGHYGNWTPNPAMKLVQLLASMKDRTGKVTIKGFYDDVIPLTVSERKAIGIAPKVDEQMQAELGFAQPDGAGKSLIELINQPSLNINGIQSANAGRLATNVITTFALATLDLRLVLGNDSKRQPQKVIDHIKSQSYFVLTDREPTEAERMKYANIARVTVRDGGYNAQRTKMDLPFSKAVIKAVQSTVDESIVSLPSLGGSLPLYLFETNLKATPITVPIANHDNNQHAENENIRLGNLWAGIDTFVALMKMK
jgi:acetylornithine deacetylase/succinyl-diaminopimelate desuccinylase-like protein